MHERRYLKFNMLTGKHNIFWVLGHYRKGVEDLLNSLPSKISAEDASDFIQLASYYSDKTPQSIREDFHYKIFGANYDDEVGDFTITKMMCLPITVHEITRKERGGHFHSNISYFIIDTRTQPISNGHIYGSFNLDCKLVVDNPDQFEIALNSLESFKNAQKFEEHLCLLGYGDDGQVWNSNFKFHMHI